MRLRRALVAAQVAISVIVLTMGFLFLRNLLHASALSPGFDVVHTLRAHVNLPPAAYSDGLSKSQYIDRTLTSLTALPGVEAAAAARVMPFNGGTHFRVQLRFPDTGEQAGVYFDWNAVTPDFFRALGIPMLKGRTFTVADRGEHTVVVNNEFVVRYLGSREPLGTVFLWGPNGKTPYRIVGVAAGTKTLTIGEDPKPQLYEWLAQIDNDRRELEFVIRSASPPALQLEPVRHTLHDIEPMAGADVDTVYGSIGLAILPSQVGAVLMGSTGVLGLPLAAIGLYGVMAFWVARRTREIGVRVAIGASRADIARMVLGDAARVTLIGIAIGLALAALVTRPLAMFLVPGLKASDPLNFAAVALAILATSLLPTWGPIVRALRIDPNAALREE
jgi:predicted permease